MTNAISIFNICISNLVSRLTYLPANAFFFYSSIKNIMYKKNYFLVVVILLGILNPNRISSQTLNKSILGTQDEHSLPVTSAFDMEEEWVSDSEINTFVPFVIGEMDNNENGSEVLAVRNVGDRFSEPNMFYILDGVNGNVKYQPNTLPISSFSKGYSIGDTDRDGLTEFFYVVSGVDANYRRLVSYEYNPAGINPNGSGNGTFELQWMSNERITAGLPVNRTWFVEDFSTALADFNQDGIPEVYVANEIFNAVTGERIATGGSNSIGSFLYDVYSGHSHPHAYPVAVDVIPDGDCDDCAGLELVAGNQVYSVNITTGTMTVIKEAPNGLPDGMTSIADYDLDGDLDGIITYTSSNGSYLYVWDLETETQIGNTHTVTTDTPSGAFRRSVSNVTISDFDGDNRPEMGVCANGIFQVVDDYTVNIDGIGGVIWSIITDDRSGLTGATSFDFNGDGRDEVVYRDETNLRIISGTNGDNLASIPCGSVTGSEYPIVVDLDNDNESEIVCSCGDPGYTRFGAMKTFQSQGTPWVSTRNIWNQYPYFVVNINDNMTIPIQQQQHQLIGNLSGGSTYQLNAFLKQAELFENDSEVVLPGLDIQTEIILNSGNVDVFPNPASEKFEIHVTDFHGKTNINIYDVYGRLFFQKEIFINQNLFTMPVDSRSFPAGTYFISLKDEKTKNITRVIVR